MRQVRELNTVEVAFVRACQSLLNETKPIVDKRGSLSEIQVPAGTVFLSSSGALMVAPKGRSLSPDSLARRKKARACFPDELARYATVVKILERCEPSVDKLGRLLELHIPGRLLRRGPSGWVAVEEVAGVTEMPELFEDAVAEQLEYDSEAEEEELDEEEFEEIEEEVLEATSVAREVVPTLRNADVDGSTRAIYRHPRAWKPRAPRVRVRPTLCPMLVLGADGRPHPCRHTLSDKIAPAWIRGGAIVDRADEPTRQSRLQKQVRIGSTEPVRSFVGSSLVEPSRTEEQASQWAEEARRGAVFGLEKAGLAKKVERSQPTVEQELAVLARELGNGSQTQLLIEDDL